MKRIVLSILTVVMAIGNISAQQATPAVPSAYAPFAVGELKPTGWLRDWAQRAAGGMTRSMGEEFAEFSRGWGDANQGGWWHYEQTAYYTDGFTRLGFLLDDSVLIKRSQAVMEAVIARQRPNGYIHSNNKDYVEKWGTVGADYGLYWSEAVFGRAALAYYSATGDQRVLDMLVRLYRNFPLFAYNSNPNHHFNGGDLDNMRRIVGLENMLEVVRLTGDAQILERAMQVFKNYEGAYIDTWARKGEFLRTGICHGVSYNESAKLPAAAYIWNGNPEYLKASVDSYEFLQANTVLPNGSNSSNEYLHGVGGWEATESCDITDFMWSNIWLARASGDRRYGDRIERDAFNALPGSVNSSFTQCLYTQAPNRIPGFHLRIRDDGNYYKEMHWPTCCPSNLNRALPNYIINMAMQNGQNELMWLTYGPAHLQTRDGQIDIEMQTNYPFNDTIRLVINRLPKDKTLRLRIPTWCDDASICLNDKNAKARVDNGFYVLRRNWKAGDVVSLVVPMKPRLVEGRELFPTFEGKKAPSWGMMVPGPGDKPLDGFLPAGRYAYVDYGPLMCGLCMQNRPGDFFDINEELWHEFRYALSPNSIEGCKVENKGMPERFSWNLANNPISISARVHLIDWNPDKGDPTMPQETPKVLERDIPVQLIPYGFMAYRMTMFPEVE